MSARDLYKDHKTKYYLSNPMGIHRIMSLPYDDSECFDSIGDLLKYCAEDNTWYNGQKVSCIMTNEMGLFLHDDEIYGSIPHIQKFTIMNGKPLPDFDNIELKRKEDNKRCVQIYYYNPSMLDNDDIIMIDNKYHSEYLNNPMKFSILDYVRIFTNNARNIHFCGYLIDLQQYNKKINFDFTYTRQDMSYSASPFFINGGAGYYGTRYTDSQLKSSAINNNPSLRNGFISDNCRSINYNYYSDNNGGLYSLICKDTDNQYILANLIPLVDSNVTKRYIVSIYVEMSYDYYNAMEARG